MKKTKQPGNKTNSPLKQKKKGSKGKKKKEKSQNKNDIESGPLPPQLKRDKLLYFLFYVQGIASLLPLFVTYLVVNFFIDKMEAYKPEYSLFIADGLGFMLIILYLLFTNKEYSAKNQIRASYIIWIINLICIPIWAFTLPPLWAFILIFLHILFNSVSLGAVESVMLELAGSISPALTTAVMGGQGYSGLMNCAVRILIELSVGQADYNAQATAIIVYFAVSIVFMIFAYFGFEYLQHVAKEREIEPTSPLMITPVRTDIESKGIIKKRRTPTPRKEGRTPTPKKEGRTPTPKKEGRTPTPKKEGRTPTPKKEGRTPKKERSRRNDIPIIYTPKGATKSREKTRHQTEKCPTKANALLDALNFPPPEENVVTNTDSKQTVSTIRSTRSLSPKLKLEPTETNREIVKKRRSRKEYRTPTKQRKKSSHHDDRSPIETNGNMINKREKREKRRKISVYNDKDELFKMALKKKNNKHIHVATPSTTSSMYKMPRCESPTMTKASYKSSFTNEIPPEKLFISNRRLELYQIWEITLQVKWLFLALVLVMFFHYLIFPGYVIKMNLGDKSCKFVALTIITVFSLCDTLGRTFANKLKCLTKALKTTLIPPIIARFAFVIVIILIPIYQNGSSLFSAWYFVIGVLVCATIIHSLLLSINIVLIMEKVKVESHEIASKLSCLFQAIGLLLGSLIAFTIISRINVDNSVCQDQGQEWLGSILNYSI